jgi:hypothetical protein
MITETLLLLIFVAFGLLKGSTEGAPHSVNQPYDDVASGVYDDSDDDDVSLSTFSTAQKPESSSGYPSAFQYCCVVSGLSHSNFNWADNRIYALNFLSTRLLL